jgi:hypothetical protein
MRKGKEDDGRRKQEDEGGRRKDEGDVRNTKFTCVYCKQMWYNYKSDEIKSLAIGQ